MRTLKRNETIFYFANPVSVEPILDENGFRTGEKRITYTLPIKKSGNISPATGSVSIEQFGSVEAYDKVIVLCEPNLDVRPTSVFWIDQLPQDATEGLEPGDSLEPSEGLTPATGSDGNVPYDYIIGHVSRSKNSISITVKAVDVK